MADRETSLCCNSWMILSKAVVYLHGTGITRGAADPKLSLTLQPFWPNVLFQPQLCHHKSCNLHSPYLCVTATSHRHFSSRESSGILSTLHPSSSKDLNYRVFLNQLIWLKLFKKLLFQQIFQHIERGIQEIDSNMQLKIATSPIDVVLCSAS